MKTAAKAKRRYPNPCVGKKVYVIKVVKIPAIAAPIPTNIKALIFTAFTLMPICEALT